MAITQDYVSWSTGNDYKGASFVDGAFTVADMTLTKAGAFAASKANHWLYLDDNGSGEVTTGYYRIASVTSADAVVLAASPKSGANDPTDVKCTQHAGTALLPWRSDQGACDLCTRNTTDGNQINVIAGAAVVHTAALDLTTFVAGGALAWAGGLTIRGCTATANDGGIGEIDAGGAAFFAATSHNYIRLVDLHLHTFGDNDGVTMGGNTVAFRCKVSVGASTPTGKALLASVFNVIGCDLGPPGASGRCIMPPPGAFIDNNYIHTDAATAATGIYVYSSINTRISNNIITCGEVNSYGIWGLVPGYINALGNTIYNSTAGTKYGFLIGASGARDGGTVINNLVVGWSGAGGIGIGGTSNAVLIGHNAYYNNTQATSIGDQTYIDLTANDVALAADPFTDAANGDFSLTAAAKTALAAKGWPTSYLGAHANTVPNLNIGPIQMAASSGGGGGGFPILGGSVVR
jgi:hypothetical protein